MSIIRLDSFGGIAPIYDPRKLPQGLAADALDVRLEGTDLRAFRVPASQFDFGFTISRLYKYRFNNTAAWLAWADPWIVDVVPSPIAADALGRLYWTRVDQGNQSGSADNYPRVASQPTQTDINNNTSVIRRLGVPASTIKATTTESFAANSCVPVTMSQTSPVTVTTATAHPFTEGQRVVVKVYKSTAAPATPTNMSEINGLEFIVGNVKPTQFDLRDSDGSHYSAFTSNTDAIIQRVYADSDLVARSYVFTLVTDWGEESAPSPPSDVTDYRFDSTVNVTCPWSIDSHYASGLVKLRVYRTISGGSGTDFFFVKDIAITGASGSVAVVDNVQDEAIGEILPSTDWLPPPNALRGLVQLPNGFMAGFIGNTVYFCEPYLPHAWPAAYRRTTATDIVGMHVFGQTLVIATKAKPYAASGTDPASMSMAELDVYAPCINKGGVCSIGFGVAYPSTNGMAVVTAAGVQIVTGDIFSKRLWASTWAVTMDAIWWDGRYIAFSREIAYKTLCFSMAADSLSLIPLSAIGRAPAIDPDDDSLHFAAKVNSTFSQRTVFDFGPTSASWSWTSKVVTLAAPASLGCGKVYADTYPVILTIRYALPTVPNGQPAGETTGTYFVTATGPEVFRLPAGFLSREWQIGIQSSGGVQAVMLAETMDELRAQ